MISVKHFVDPLPPLLRDAFATADSLVPLKSLRHGFLEDVFTHVQPQSVVQGEAVFHEGAFDHQYIYLISGRVELRYGSGRTETVDADRSLLPLAHAQPRHCTAVATTDAMVLRIDADRLDRSLSWSQMIDYMLSELSLDRSRDNDMEWMHAVLSSNLFLKVPPVNAEQIFDKLSHELVEKGQRVIEQGAVGDCCYFLRSGTAMIEKQAEDGSVDVVAEILPGRCFGEDALVDSQPRNASVVMATDGELLRLDSRDFEVLLKEPVIETVSMAECDQGQALLIDVRTQAEYALGHLAYSANIPLSLMSMKKRLLATEQAYVLYCDTGRRSGAAACYLGKEGFDVVALAGGLQGQGLTEHLVDDDGYLLRDGQLFPSGSTEHD